VFRRVGGKLVQHHCYDLTGLRTQNDLGAADLGVVACGTGCKLLPHEFYQRYSLPSTKTQQLMYCRHRAKAPVQCLNEVGDSDRSSAARSLGNHGANGCQYILHSVIQLGEQYALALLRPLSLSRCNCKRRPMRSDPDHHNG
jgi:hypothetical protein